MFLISYLRCKDSSCSLDGWNLSEDLENSENMLQLHEENIETRSTITNFQSEPVSYSDSQVSVKDSISSFYEYQFSYL